MLENAASWMIENMGVAITLVGGGLGIYLLGQSLINAYFRRKEMFVDTLNKKLKGKGDGPYE